MPMFRKKPVTIEAQQLPPADARLARPRMNVTEDLAEWCGGRPVDDAVRGWCIIIPTLEGDHLAEPGDFIIKGVAGEFYPCKEAIFAQTYEPVMPEGFTGGEG